MKTITLKPGLTVPLTAWADDVSQGSDRIIAEMANAVGLTVAEMGAVLVASEAAQEGGGPIYRIYVKRMTAHMAAIEDKHRIH